MEVETNIMFSSMNKPEVESLTRLCILITIRLILFKFLCYSTRIIPFSKICSATWSKKRKNVAQFDSFQCITTVNIKNSQRLQNFYAIKLYTNNRKLCIGYMTQDQYTQINCIFYISITNIYKWNFKKICYVKE